MKKTKGPPFVTFLNFKVALISVLFAVGTSYSGISMMLMRPSSGPSLKEFRWLFKFFTLRLACFFMTKVALVKSVADAKLRGAAPNGFQFQSQHEILNGLE